MGSRHFEEMYEEALQEDQRAFMSAINMCRPLSIALRVYGADYWEKTPLDAVVDKARGLLELDDAFTDALRELIANRRLSVMAFDKKAGRVRHVYEPALIADGPYVDRLTFFPLVMKFIVTEI